MKKRISLQEGSGFQKLLEQSNKAQGPKVLKGLPIKTKKVPAQAVASSNTHTSLPQSIGAANTQAELVSQEGSTASTRETTLVLPTTDASVVANELAAPRDKQLPRNTEAANSSETGTQIAPLTFAESGKDFDQITILHL